MDPIYSSSITAYIQLIKGIIVITKQQTPSIKTLTPYGRSFNSNMTSSLAVFTTLLLLSVTVNADLMLTVVNNCPFPIWPAIQPNSGNQILESGGFCLPSYNHRSFAAPNTPWSGRIWARTHCTSNSPTHLSCITGDCNSQFACNGAGGNPPATLAQFSLHHGGQNDFSSYGVSLVDGYNVPMTVTPHEGRGVCPVVGCKPDLLPTCPQQLQLKLNNQYGTVVGCKSGCEAFRSDELCCKNQFNNPQTCKPSEYSQYFKKACPSTFTYAHDSPSLMHQCSSPRELKVIFCH